MNFAPLFKDRASISALAQEYAALRLQDPSFTGWIGGAAALLAVSWATSPGRRLASVLPPPRIARVLVAPLPKRADAAEFVPRSSWEKFKFLLRIAIPPGKSREKSVIVLMIVLMVLRTGVSVLMTRTAGVLGKAAVEGRMWALLKATLGYLLYSFPAAVLETSLSYLSQMLDLHFRENVTKYFHRRYLSEKVFFRLAGLHDIDHVDQRITEDVQRWSRAASVLFINVPRPCFETVVFAGMLTRLTGLKGPLLAGIYYLGFLFLGYFCAPNIDWMANEQLEKEGIFRASHQELLSYVGEVAMTRGFAFQESLFKGLFRSVTDHARYAAYVHARFNFLQLGYTKYGTVLLGYIMCGLSSQQHRDRATDAASTMELYTETSHTFVKFAKSAGRILSNIKLLLATNGYTQRVFQLVEALDLAEHEVTLQHDLMARSPLSSMIHLDSSALLMSPSKWTYGRIIHGEHIEFIDVPLKLPDGEVLFRSLSFFVRPGMNLLIMGPNGCGKSSTFRLLGELWPLRGGRIVKPEREQMYYVPQRPYMYDGTLFDQVIYPLRRKDVTVSESELYNCMEMAGLAGLFDKPGVSWNSRLSWCDDTLSVGEKQRLAMARLFFHRPRFAILDECSSLVDLEIEEDLYARCRELGISLITIAHRRSVWQYHNWILHFDGHGNYLFSPLRFEEGGSTLVLSCVTSAFDEALIGTEVIVKVSDRWEDEQISAQLAEEEE